MKSWTSTMDAYNDGYKSGRFMGAVAGFILGFFSCTGLLFVLFGGW